MSAALEHVVDGYGGRALWNRVERIRLRARIGGWVLRLKGMGLTFPSPTEALVYPARGRVELPNFPRQGELGVYEQGSVEATAHARVDGYRRRFDGLKKYRLWSTLDAIYFFGYSITSYLKIPFELVGQQGIEVAREREETVADVTFAAGADTHSTRQRLLFGQDGRLARHDYRADILGWWATASHYSSDYQTVAGLPIARRRVVRWRMFGWVSPIVVIDVHFDDVAIAFQEHKGGTAEQ